MNRQLCLGLVVLSIACPFLAFSQASASVWDGIYTDDQAAKGATSYSSKCASCHGSKLEGKGPTPPLTGADFLMNWNGMMVGDLFEKIQSSMPADKPGQLSKGDNASILAYVLKINKFPSGEKEIPADPGALSKTRFDAGRQPK